MWSCRLHQVNLAYHRLAVGLLRCSQNIAFLIFNVLYYSKYFSLQTKKLSCDLVLALDQTLGNIIVLLYYYFNFLSMFFSLQFPCFEISSSVTFCEVL